MACPQQSLSAEPGPTLHLLVLSLICPSCSDTPTSPFPTTTPFRTFCGFYCSSALSLTVSPTVSPHTHLILHSPSSQWIHGSTDPHWIHDSPRSSLQNLHISLPLGQNPFFYVVMAALTVLLTLESGWAPASAADTTAADTTAHSSQTSGSPPSLWVSALKLPLPGLTLLSM